MSANWGKPARDMWLSDLATPADSNHQLNEAILDQAAPIPPVSSLQLYKWAQGRPAEESPCWVQPKWPTHIITS